MRTNLDELLERVFADPPAPPPDPPAPDPPAPDPPAPPPDPPPPAALDKLLDQVFADPPAPPPDPPAPDPPDPPAPPPDPPPPAALDKLLDQVFADPPAPPPAPPPDPPPPDPPPPDPPPPDPPAPDPPARTDPAEINRRLDNITAQIDNACNDHGYGDKDGDTTHLGKELVLLAVETTLVVDLVEAAKDAADKCKAANTSPLIEKVSGIVNKVTKALKDNKGVSNSGSYEVNPRKRRMRDPSLVELEKNISAIKQLVYPVDWYARFARSQQIHATLLTTDQPRPLPVPLASRFVWKCAFRASRKFVRRGVGYSTKTGWSDPALNATVDALRDAVKSNEEQKVKGHTNPDANLALREQQEIDRALKKSLSLTALKKFIDTIRGA